MRTWAHFHRERTDWRRRLRRCIIGAIGTATRRLIPRWYVLAVLAAVAWAVGQVVTVTRIP